MQPQITQATRVLNEENYLPNVLKRPRNRRNLWMVSLDR